MITIRCYEEELFDEPALPYLYNPINATHPKVAYMIMVHNLKSLEEGLFLLENMHNKEDRFLFMVDLSNGKGAKIAKDIQAEIDKKAKKWGKNVRVETTDYSLTWGGIGLIQAELDAIQSLLKDKSWDFFINLSGDSFPLFKRSEYPPPQIEIQIDSHIGA
eukprot:TRINITY_DN2598_c0_g1_i1.p1 TRINITY_DN2598_c0_g1~~TRINITY_DN2598_c0_g1_i1.p1  ORF type:complete len:176 (-),score=44.37 TRINITY_DN2598_c0_g1_i1:359-841(-)